MRKQSQDRFFHWLSPIYDLLIRRPEVGRLETLLRLPSDGRLLDLGGGTGRVSQHLRMPMRSVVVGDINPSMLRRAKRKRGLLPLLADAARLPFPADAFDGILVVDALHHFRKPRYVLDEMLRVLKPDGCLVIEEQDVRHVLIKLVSTAEKAVGLHSCFLTSGEIVALFDPERYRIYVEEGRFFTFRVLISRR